MSTLSLSFNGKKYDIHLEDEFEETILGCIDGVFDPKKDNDVKQLIQAYFKKCYEFRELERELEVLLLKLEKSA